ncbi:MAG: nucleoside deaminase [Planifilum sp.]|jgi:guanine deaminase
MDHQHWLKEAVNMAVENVRSGHGGPFAAIIVQNGEVIGRGVNEVTTKNDPTAHAEIQAIRQACERLETSRLAGALLYASGEPCSMCTAAIYWAGIEAVYVACSTKELLQAGYPDGLAHYRRDRQKPPEEWSIPFQTIPVEGYLEPFHLWKKLNAD